jgi:hypothetical protein
MNRGFIIFVDKIRSQKNRNIVSRKKYNYLCKSFGGQYFYFINCSCRCGLPLFLLEKKRGKELLFKNYLDCHKYTFFH